MNYVGYFLTLLITVAVVFPALVISICGVLGYYLEKKHEVSRKMAESVRGIFDGLKSEK